MRFNFILSFFIFLFLISLVGALDVHQQSKVVGVNIIPETTVNYSLIPTVNSSDYWDDLDSPLAEWSVDRFYNWTSGAGASDDFQTSAKIGTGATVSSVMQIRSSHSGAATNEYGVYSDVVNTWGGSSPKWAYAVYGYASHSSSAAEKYAVGVYGKATYGTTAVDSARHYGLYGDATGGANGDYNDFYGYGLYASASGWDYNYAGWFDAGDVRLGSDNQKIQIGATATDLEISSDGTNPVYNSTGVHTFYNTTGLGTIRVGSIVYSTPENKDYSALDNLVNPDELTRIGKSDSEFHQSFPEEITKIIQVKDPDNCTEVINKYCYNETGEIHCYEKEIEGLRYDYIINRTECGTKDEIVVDSGDWEMFNYKAIWELQQENEMLKSELCNFDNNFSWCK